MRGGQSSSVGEESERQSYRREEGKREGGEKRGSKKKGAEEGKEKVKRGQRKLKG